MITKGRSRKQKTKSAIEKGVKIMAFLWRSRNWGMTALATWLILFGVFVFVRSIPWSGDLLGLLGIIAGVLLLMGR